MSDWVDVYIDNSGLSNVDNKPPFETTAKEGDAAKDLPLAEKIKQVIRKCLIKEKDYFTEDNFKKLKFILVNEFAFNDIKGISTRNNNEKYEYFIFMGKDSYELNDKDPDLFNRKIAHELAHFLFKLQDRHLNNKDIEEKEACSIVTKWGF